MADNDALKLRIIVDGKQAIPEAMAEASAAVQTATQKINTGFSKAQAASSQTSTRMGADLHKARGSVDLLGDSIGIGIPRELKKVIAGMPGVQGALAAAFEVFAVVAFIEVLAEIPDAIEKGVNALRGWNEEAKKAFSESVAAAREAEKHVRELTQGTRDLGAVGQDGVSKLNSELGIAKTNAMESGRALAETAAKVSDLQSEVDELSVAWSRWFRGEEIDKKKTELESLRPVQKSLTDQAYSDALKVRSLSAESAAEQKKDALTLATAKVEADRKVGDAALTLKEAQVRGAVLLGRMGLAEETEALKSNEEQKYQVAKEYLEKRRALALREQRETGKPAGPAIAGINADEAAARRQTDARIQTIEDQAAAQTIQRENEVALARINARSRYEEGAITMDEQTIHRLAELHQLSIDQEREALEKLSDQRVGIERRSVEQQLAIANQFPERNAAQIAGLEAQLNQITADGEARRAEIHAEAQQKQLAQDQQFADMRMHQAERAADFELQQAQRSNNQRLASGQEMLGGWERNELDALQRWYDAQRQTLQAALEFARNTYGENSVQYAEALQRMNELDNERLTRVQEVQDRILAAVQRTTEQESEVLLGNLRQWALGHQTFKEALANTWNEILLDLASSLAKMGLKWAAHWALVNLLHIGAKEKDIATEATAAIAKHAINSAANIATVSSEAAVAGAAGFASVMVALPFPANVAVAPVVAASSIGEVMSMAPLAAFERGGVVDKDKIALVHKNEMVLPSKISEKLQRMVGDEAHASGQGSSMNVTMHVTGVSRKDAEAVGDTIAAKIKKAFRNGQLGYGDVSS